MTRDYLKKKDLTKEETRIYNGLRATGKDGIVYSDEQKLKMLRPVLVYMVNSFFDSWNRELRRDKKEHDFIRWYFDNGLVPDLTQMAIIRKNSYYSNNYYKYSFLVLTKPIIKAAIEADANSILMHAIEKGNLKLAVTVLRERPNLFDVFQRGVRKHRKKTQAFDAYFIERMKRMVLLSDPSSRQGIYVVPSTRLQTPSFCKRYVSLAGGNLNYLETRNKTPEICLLAVTKSGTALQYVPEKLKTPEICAMALKNSPTALRFMTAEQQQSKLVLRALFKNKNARRYIKKGAVGFSAK